MSSPGNVFHRDVKGDLLVDVRFAGGEFDADFDADFVFDWVIGCVRACGGSYHETNLKNVS